MLARRAVSPPRAVPALAPSNASWTTKLRFHLEHAIEKQVAAGMPRDEAARRARLEFGGVEQIKEDCRDARGVASPRDDSCRICATACARCGGRRCFPSTAIVTIALVDGGAGDGVHASRDTMLFRPLRGGASRSEIVAVCATRGRPTPEGVVSYADYVRFRDGTHDAERGSPHTIRRRRSSFRSNGNVEEVNGAVVSANFFPLLGISPALGRFFHDDEDRSRIATRVVVLGYDFWRTWFRASPDAVGAARSRINGAAFTVIGVAPRNFRGASDHTGPALHPDDDASYRLPMVRDRWRLLAACTILEMAGRLAPGRSVSDVTGELTTLRPEAWLHAKVGENSGIEVRASSVRRGTVGRVNSLNSLAAVGIVLLLVCCANLAGPAHGAGLGAAVTNLRFACRSVPAAARVIRQFMTESLMLAVVGGVGGCCVLDRRS